MSYFVGIGVSLEEASVCVVNNDGDEILETCVDDQPSKQTVDFSVLTCNVSSILTTTGSAMLNFCKSIILAALATFPVFTVALPIQSMLVSVFIDMQAGRSFSIDFTEWMSVEALSRVAAFGGIAAGYALIIGGIGAILVDKYIMTNGGSKKQYAVAGAGVGFIGSGLFAFVFAAPAALAGFIAGWVYGANRKLGKRTSK